MAHVFRKLAKLRSSKIGDRSKDEHVQLSRCESSHKERDKLLQEFLLAREELKEQFDYEKEELVFNYERRLKHLRRLIEEYDQNINTIKLNLDTEKEKNFILKTRLIKIENHVDDKETQSSGENKQIYEDESTVCLNDETLSKYENYYEESLKFSCQYDSIDSIAKSSLTSITMETMTCASSLKHGVQSENVDLHENCREEFNRLLNELRQQQAKFENEKLQLEKVVFKQLSLKLEKEVKRHELLCTENTHLRKTITDTTLNSLMDYFKSKPSPDKIEWKENNSDSGADVEYNRSDDESDISSRTSGSHMNGLKNGEDTVSASLICSLLQEQKKRLANEFQKMNQREQKKYKNVIDELNEELVMLVRENRLLKEQMHKRDRCSEDVSQFHNELTRKLFTLEELLIDDTETC